LELPGHDGRYACAVCHNHGLAGNKLPRCIDFTLPLGNAFVGSTGYLLHERVAACPDIYPHFRLGSIAPAGGAGAGGRLSDGMSAGESAMGLPAGDVDDVMGLRSSEKMWERTEWAVQDRM